jgi:hypothetical protein
MLGMSFAILPCIPVSVPVLATLGSKVAVLGTATLSFVPMDRLRGKDFFARTSIWSSGRIVLTPAELLAEADWSGCLKQPLFFCTGFPAYAARTFSAGTSISTDRPRNSSSTRIRSLAGKT